MHKDPLMMSHGRSEEKCCARMCSEHLAESRVAAMSAAFAVSFERDFLP